MFLNDRLQKFKSDLNTLKPEDIHTILYTKEVYNPNENELKLEGSEGRELTGVELNALLEQGLGAEGEGEVSSLFKMEMENHHVSMLDKLMRNRDTDAYNKILSMGENVIK